MLGCSSLGYAAVILLQMVIHYNTAASLTADKSMPIAIVQLPSRGEFTAPESNIQSAPVPVGVVIDEQNKEVLKSQMKQLKSLESQLPKYMVTDKDKTLTLPQVITDDQTVDKMVEEVIPDVTENGQAEVDSELSKIELSVSKLESETELPDSGVHQNLGKLRTPELTSDLAGKNSGVNDVDTIQKNKPENLKNMANARKRNHRARNRLRGHKGGYQARDYHTKQRQRGRHGPYNRMNRGRRLGSAVNVGMKDTTENKNDELEQIKFTRHLKADIDDVMELMFQNKKRNRQSTESGKHFKGLLAFEEM